MGLSVDVFKEMGSAVVSLPGGEIVPALDRGLVDAAEFNNASSDRLLGFPDVSKICMLQSYHQPLECFEVIFNKKQVRRAAGRHQDHHHHCGPGLERRHVVEGDRPLLEGLRRDEGAGRQVLPDPEGSAAGPARQAWDKVIAAKSAENPFFKQVLESQRKFAQRVVAWSNDTIVSSEVAYDYYFPKKA